MSRDVIRAGGGVLWRPSAGSGHDGIEVALIHRPRYDDWSLPKGKLDPGEHPVEAAGREVVEETGLHPAVGARLPSTSYKTWSADGVVPKTVDYWAMRSRAGQFVPNDEVDHLEWMGVGDAAKRLTQPHDARVVEALAALPRVTATVLLVRHAKAGDRHGWTSDDDLRPIDKAGQAQALRIAAVLPWFAPDRALTAEPVRCVQTVTPLAEVLGVPLALAPEFGERSHAYAPRRAVTAVRELAGAGGVTVVCSQGGAIPDTVATLADEDGMDLADIPSRKGSAWALSFHHTALVQADYYPAFEPERPPVT